VKWPAALLLPSFGAMVFAVTLIEVLFLAQGPQGLFRDSDTGWHVRNGETILQTFTVPRVDPFSYTRGGEPWFAWEWLSDAVFGAVHSFAGLSGVALLIALTIALMAWGVARLALSLGANLFLTAAGIVILLGTTGIHWLARPHVFSWLFALAFVAVAEHERRAGSWAVYALPALACLWANMHGSFLLGPSILFIYAVATRWRNRLGLVALLSLLATLINPYGWRLHEHVITYLQNDYLMDRISEFRSFSFHSPGAIYIELFLFGSVIGILALLRQRAYAPALLGVAMLHMSLYSARHFPTAAVVLLPPVLAALTREARKYGRLDSLLNYSERLYGMDRRVWGIVPVVVVLIACVAGMGTLNRAGAVDFDPDVFPVKAANFLEENNFKGRVFARDYWGGYLIYRFAGNTKVFIDGRSDFYGRELLEAYSEIVEVKPAWNEVLKQYDAGLVLISPEHALAAVLELSPEWRRIYSDPVATIFERAG
jgi:hypothetical protein